MNEAKENPKGFSLIELMVSLAILMILMSLVAPYGVNIIDRYKAQAELQDTRQFLKNASLRAFLTGESLRLKVDNQEIIVEGKEIYFGLKVENIIFTPDQLNLNSSGMPDKEFINVYIGQRAIRVNLFELIYGY